MEEEEEGEEELSGDENQKKLNAPAVVNESSDEDSPAYESYEERILDIERRLRSHQTFFGKHVQSEANGDEACEAVGAEPPEE